MLNLIPTALNGTLDIGALFIGLCLFPIICIMIKELVAENLKDEAKQAPKMFRYVSYEDPKNFIAYKVK